MKTKNLALTLLLACSLFHACGGDNETTEAPAPGAAPTSNDDAFTRGFDYSNKSYRDQVIKYSSEYGCTGDRLAINRAQQCRNLQVDFQNNFQSRDDRRDLFDKHCGNRWNREETLKNFYASDNIFSCTVSNEEFLIDNHLSQASRPNNRSLARVEAYFFLRANWNLNLNMHQNFGTRYEYRNCSSNYNHRFYARRRRLISEYRRYRSEQRYDNFSYQFSRDVVASSDLDLRSYIRREIGCSHPTDYVSQMLHGNLMLMQLYNEVIEIKRVSQNSNNYLQIAIYDVGGKLKAKQAMEILPGNYNQITYKYTQKGYRGSKETYVNCYKVENRQQWHTRFDNFF